jgi:hypothetical protein
MLTGAGGNIGVSAGPDGVFLVDDQYAPLTDKIKAAIATVSDKPVRILAAGDAATKIIPGHGPLATKADVKAFRDMLAASRDAIQPLVKAGKTLDQVKAAKPTAALDEKWGNGFIKPEVWTTVVFFSYGGREPEPAK